MENRQVVVVVPFASRAELAGRPRADAPKGANDNSAVEWLADMSEWARQSGLPEYADRLLLAAWSAYDS
jgi:hypothetical protein